ncbi:hypothetical protein [Nocardioides marmorisolisilvae]|uniref:Nuclear transport factor 2 family protein n=1 Tax=Nocardioides marmorisolisilvae TaxID=1542737 RepID=A0A3N0DTL9_9ACTN|nr:hypothetical protein [Nocardioides marmorisolisilvae]RNL78753.1 hypothetical protein EFL95_06675 [Nocardioides marmorisolisilvae]
MSAATETRPDATTAVAGLIRFLETGEVAEGLFAPDMFSDVSLPTWWLQAETADRLVAIREHAHPFRGTVQVQRVDPTDRGFVIEFEERWEDKGERWYAREIIRADVEGATITEMAIYCTGDWDDQRQREHAEQVALVRP